MNRRRQLAFQLSFRYALLIVISFALIYASFYLIMTRAMVRERSNLLNQRLGIITDGLDNRLNTVMVLQTNLLRDETFQNSLKNPAVSQSLSSQLNRYRTDSYLFSAIYLFDSSFHTLGLSRPNTEKGGIDPELHDAVRQFARTYAFRQFITTSDGSLYFLFSLYPPENYHYSTYGAAQINRDRLLFDFSKDLLETFSAARIHDSDDVIAVIGDRGLFEENNVGSGDSLAISKRHITFETICKAYSAWKITALYDQSMLQRASETQLRFLLLIFLLTVLVTLVISVLMAKGIVRPVRMILESMKHLEKGEFPLPLKVRRDDEIGQLVNGYNHAAMRLAELNREILSEQQEKHRYEVLSVKTQLDLLQNQINPHFIHNTLNTLNYMALKEGNTELSDTITCFNSLLRGSISITRDYSTVSEEIEYVRQYMHIQKQRYADREIQCFYSVDDTSKDAKLPRMILQPLVENSLFHGILPNHARPGEIHVVCLTQNDMISIYIADNGIGIPEERLEKINRGEIRMTNGYSHIGLNNVKERLSLMYPSKNRFAIISQEGSGTTIFFSIPYQR